MSDAPRRRERRYLFDDGRNVRRLLWSLYGACAVVFAADFFANRHGYRSWELLPSFYALFSVAACLVLVLVARQLRKVLIRRDDSYK